MPVHPGFDFSRLSIPERLQLVEDLWDSIAQDATPESLPVSDAHKAVLDARQPADDDAAATGRPWRDVLGEIANRDR